MSDKPQKVPSSVPRLNAASHAALARIGAGRTPVNLDTVDFAPMLGLVKPLSVLTGQLAEWEHDGHLGPTGADMYFRIGEQWTALESAIVAAGLAHSNPLWIVGDKRRYTAVEALLELVRDRRTGYIGHEPICVRFSNEDAEIGETELEEAADMEARTPFTSAVQAKRLGLAVAMLEELQMPPTVSADALPADLKAAQDGAIDLVELSDGIWSLMALAKPGDDTVASIAELVRKLKTNRPACHAAIKTVAAELRETRASPASFGDVIAATAHEAAVEMARTAASAVWADGLPLETKGRPASFAEREYARCAWPDGKAPKIVREYFAESIEKFAWPDVREIVAAVKIEAAHAAKNRRAAAPLAPKSEMSAKRIAGGDTTPHEAGDDHSTKLTAGETKTGRPAGSKPRMTVNQANENAVKHARKLRQGFFALSERQQAELIGCSWATWKKTEFYRTAQTKKTKKKAEKLTSPRVETLTSGREAVTGEGDKDEVLQKLIADQEADKEPSPLERDPPDRPRKIHSRKRL